MDNLVGKYNRGRPAVTGYDGLNNRRQEPTGIAAIQLTEPISGIPGGTAAMDPSLAGGCTVNITPTSPLKGYYGTEFSRNEEEESDVLAHAMVFNDGRTEAALVSLDITAVDLGVVLTIRELCQLRCGIPAGNVFVAANHVHSAPHAAPMFLFGSHPDPVYVDFLVRQIVSAVATAKSRMAPAKLVAGKVRVPGLVFNRRLVRADGVAMISHLLAIKGMEAEAATLEPEGKADDELGYILFEADDKTPIAWLTSLACHNHVSGSPHFHRDLGGRTGDALRRHLGADFATPFVQGACGDTMWLDPAVGLRADGPAKAIEIGERLASTAIEDAAQRPRVPISNVSVVTRLFEIPDRTPEDSQYCDDGCRGSDEESLAFARNRYEPERRAVEKRGVTSCAVELGAMAIGDVAVSCNPAELFTELGMEIKRKSPFSTTIISELTNGYCGYVPTERAFEHRGYETHRTVFTSRLAKNAAAIIVDRSLELLDEARGSQK
jgi:hypothetical protein